MRLTSMQFLAVALTLLTSIPMLSEQGAPARRAGGFESLGSFLSANGSTTSTTWAPTTSAALNSGELGVCVIAKDEGGAGTTDGTGNAEYTSITDTASNTWVERIEWCNMQTATTSNGACIGIYTTTATSTLASGQAITITFGVSTLRKAATCWRFSRDGTVSLAAGSNGLANDAGDPGSLSDATTVEKQHLFVRGTACESNAGTYIPDDQYASFDLSASNSNSGTTATSQEAAAEWRIANEATSAASDPTWTTADCASAIVALDE